MREWLRKTSLIGDDPIAAPEAAAGTAAAGSDDPYFCIYGGEDTGVKDF